MDPALRWISIEKSLSKIRFFSIFRILFASFLRMLRFKGDFGEK